ncbi:MAG: Ig-like domain-containing protein [Lachnospiraceae bacterium]|nr:Ig-like domain-containing protein [Lachnospiraceae bacterium]
MRKRLFGILTACSLFFGSIGACGIVKAVDKETAGDTMQVVEVNEDSDETAETGSLTPGAFDVEVNEAYVEEAELAVSNYELEGEVDTPTFADSDVDNTYPNVSTAVAAALDTYQTIIEFPTDKESTWSFPYTDKSEITTFVNNFLQANPKFFYVASVSYVTQSGFVKRLIFTFTDTNENIEKMRGELALAVARASFKAKDISLIDSEKCLLAHDYLVEHCEYDDAFDGLTDAQKKVSNSINAYGALVEGKAVCQGYTAAYTLIMQKLGITCLSVSSKLMGKKYSNGTYAGHIWNLVKLGDNYYHVDATWDDTGIPGMVKHNNLLRCKKGIEETGHHDFTLDAYIAELTMKTTYENAYWINITSPVVSYNGALYYIYPADPDCERADEENLTADADFIFVKKPIGQTGTDQNVPIYSFNYDSIAINTAGYSKSDIDKLIDGYKSLNMRGRLLEGVDYWYTVSNNKIYKIDKTKADEATKPEETKAALTDEDVTVLLTVEGDSLDGLGKESGRLTYRQGGELFMTEEDLGVPVATELYVYRAGETILLSPIIKQYGKSFSDYPVYATLLPEGSAQNIKYTMDTFDSGHLEVDAAGVVKAKSYTDGTESMTVSSADDPSVPIQKISFKVQYVALKKLIISNATIYKDLTTAEFENKSFTKKLYTQVVPANASNNIVKYMSEDPNVASVDANTGLVTAVGPGETKIIGKLTVRDKEGKVTDNLSVSCAVRFRYAPESITVNKENMSLSIKETKKDITPEKIEKTEKGSGTLTALIGTANAYDRTVKWEIEEQTPKDTSGVSAESKKVISITPSDKAEADGSYSATVNALNEGTAKVKVYSSVNSKLSKTIGITVTKEEIIEQTPTEEPTTASTAVKVTGISVTPEKAELTTYGIVDLIAEVSPSNADNNSILWTVSDSNGVLIEPDSKDSRICRVTALNRGTVKVTATSMDGAYSATATITVKKADIASAKVKKIADKVYSGKAKKPAPVLTLNGTKLKKGKDYTVSYKNNKKIGTATITIKGKGQITGTKKVTFKIVPKATKLTLKKDKKGSVNAILKKVKSGNGYQIVIATNSKFTKNKKVKNLYGVNSRKYALTGLKKGKYYYIKARAVKIVGVRKYYGKFTKVTKFKIKK